MAGFNNDTVVATNVDFSGGFPVVGKFATNGQLLIGTTIVNAGGTHINIGNITSPLGTISIGYSSPNITMDIVGGGVAVEHLTGNTGGALNPDGANNFNTIGTGSITIAGAGSTLTTQLTGLTANSVLYGLGTATIGLVASGTTGQVLQTNTGAAPTYSTATYPSTTVVSQLLYSSSTNVVGGITTANDGVLITSNTGVPSWLANGTTGQLLTATTGSPPTWTTVTTVFPWTDTSGTVTAASNNGYFITTTCTSTLPAAPAQGDVVKYIVDTTNLLTITGNTGQLIRLGNTITAAAGTAVNTLRGDSIELIYRSSGTTWESLSANGQWNLT